MKKARNRYFKAPKSTYVKGTVHMMNFDRKSFNNELGWFDADATIGKYRYGIIISDTVSNQVGCTVIPIKTDRGTNQFCYELYLPICVDDDIPGLVCISQATYLPNECIDPVSYGELKDSYMNEIYDMLDVHLGRKDIEDIPKVEKTASTNIDGVSFSEYRTYLRSLQDDETDVKDIAALLGMSPSEAILSAIKCGYGAFKEVDSYARKLSDYMEKLYVRKTDLMGNYFKVSLENIIDDFNNKLAMEKFVPIENDKLVKSLLIMDYRVITWRKERFVIGLVPKSVDIKDDFLMYDQSFLMDKYNLSPSEYMNIKFRLFPKEK